MRPAPLFALTLAATFAVAPIAMAGDRYGPPPVRGAGAPGQPSSAPTQVSYGGPTLGWPGKVAMAPAAPSAPLAPVAPQRLANGLYGGRPSYAPQAPQPPTTPQPPTPPTAPLPDSLYAPARPVDPIATLPPPPGPTKLAASPYAGSSPRAYSVIREYGGTPDPIAPPFGAGSPAYRPETSLVTPLDDPKPKKPRTADASDPDWGASDDPGLTEGNP